MKVTGGGDIDWMIEHNDHFTILEVKEFHDEMLLFTKGQMIAFEKLYLKLKDCNFFLIGHEGSDFKNPRDDIWILEIRDWIKSIKQECIITSNKKYVIKKSQMKKIDIKILRDIINAAWD